MGDCRMTRWLMLTAILLGIATALFVAAAVIGAH